MVMTLYAGRAIFIFIIKEETIFIKKQLVNNKGYLISVGNTIA